MKENEGHPKAFRKQAFAHWRSVMRTRWSSWVTFCTERCPPVTAKGGIEGEELGKHPACFRHSRSRSP